MHRALSRVSVHSLQGPLAAACSAWLSYWPIGQFFFVCLFFCGPPRPPGQFFLTFCVSEGADVSIQPISVLLQYAPLSTHVMDLGGPLKQAQQDMHLQIPITTQSWKGGLPTGFAMSYFNAALKFS